MILEALAGIIIGGFGAIPFIHPNLILQSLLGFFGNSISLAIFAVSVSISHAFFSAVPSLLMISGFFSNNNPGGIVKIFKTSLLAISASIALLPIAYFLLPFLKSIWGEGYKFLFLTIIISNFVSERDGRTAIAGICIFLLSGAFGTMTFFRSIVSEPLFPMLSGFFAVPALLFGREKTKELGAFLAKGESIGERESNGDGINRNLGAIGKTKVETRHPNSAFSDEKTVVFACVLASAISTLFPAMTVGVMLGILMLILRDESAFQIAVPALMVSKVFYDFAAAGITGATRSYGSVLALPLMEIYGNMGLFLICGVALMAGCLAVAICIKMEGEISRLQGLIETIGARRAFLIGMASFIFIFGGVYGVLIAATSACLGVLGQQIGAKRSFLMGALLVPALIFQFGLAEEIKGLLF